MNYIAHPIADIFPMMSETELRELAADIGDNGQQEDIWLYEGKVLDGRNRLKACQLACVEPKFRAYRDSDPLAFVLSKNLRRRHLNEAQRSMVATKVATLKNGQRKSPTAIAVAQQEAAESLGVSVDSIQRARAVIEDGVPELAAAVEAGDVAVSAAAEVAKLPKAKQKRIVAGGPEAVRKAASEARKKKAKPDDPTPPEPAKPAGITPEVIADRITKVKGFPEPTIQRFKRDGKIVEKVIDMTGNPIPDCMGDLFADNTLRDCLSAIEDAAEMIDLADKELLKASTSRITTASFAWVDWVELNSQMKKFRDAAVNVTTILRDGLPFAVCPHCHGDKNGCKKCRLCGYWPRAEVETHPALFRKTKAEAA